MKSNVETYGFSYHELFKQDLTVVPNKMARDKTFVHSASSDSLVATMRVTIDSSIIHLKTRCRLLKNFSEKEMNPRYS